MKKFVGIFTAFVALISLTACGGKTLKCTYEQEETKMIQTFELDKDDKVTKVTMEMVATADSEDDAKQAETMYKGILTDEEGVTYSVKRSGKTLTLKGVADLSKTPADNLETYIGTTTNSKDAVKKAFEEDGYKCN